MNDENYDAWNKASESRAYYAVRLAMGLSEGDMAEVARFLELFKEADAEMDRLDRELTAGDEK